MSVFPMLILMSFKGVEVPFTILGTAFQVEEPVQAVVGSHAEWAGLFEHLTIPSGIGMLEYPPVLPAFVDFETRMLVIVGLGKTADVGAGNNRSICIDSLFVLEDVLYVHYSASGPEDCGSSTLGGFVYPSCMAVIERAGVTPVFISTPGSGI